MKRKSKLLQSMLLPVLGFVLVYFATPIEWDHYDGLEASLKAGIGSDFRIKETYIYSYWLITYAIVPLQQYFINTPVITLFTLVVFFISYSFYTYACISDIPHKNHFYRLLIVLLLFVVMLPAFAKLSKAGSSFMLTGLSLYCAAFYASAASRQRQKIGIVFICTLLFALGYLIRIESAFGATLIVGLYIAIIKIKEPKTLLYIAPLLLSGLILTILIFNTMNRIPFLKATEPALYYLADGVYRPPIEKNHTAVDSMKILAISSFFLNDSKELSIDFINKAAAEKLSLEKTQEIKLIDRVKIAWQIAKPTVSYHYQYLVMCILLIVLAVFYFRSQSTPLIVFNILFWLITFSLAYLVKLEDRHYIYMSQLMIFCNLQFLLQKKFFNPSLYNGLLILLIAVLGICIHHYSRLVLKSSALKKELQIRTLAEKEIDEVARGKYLFFDNNAIELYRSHIFDIRKFSGANRLLFFDMGQMPIMPEYKAYLDETCNCNSRDLKQFLKWMIRHQNEIVIVSSLSRTNFVSSYIKIVCNSSIIYKPFDKKYALQKVKLNSNSLNYFTIGEE